MDEVIKLIFYLVAFTIACLTFIFVISQIIMYRLEIRCEHVYKSINPNTFICEKCKKIKKLK